MSTTRFKWATGPNADVTTIPVAKRLIGWLFREPPAHDLQNWLFQKLAELTGSAGKYDTLEAAYQDLDVGDTAIVDEDNDAVEPGDRKTSTTPGTVAAGAFDFASVHSTAARVLVARYGDTDDNYSIPRDLSWSGDIIQYAKTNAGAAYRIIGDDEIVLLAYGNYLEAFEPDGTSRWVYDHGAAVRDVCCDGDSVYMVGSAGTEAGNPEIVAVDRTNGIALWNYTHGATLHSVATDGVQVYAAGIQSGLVRLLYLDTLGNVNVATAMASNNSENLCLDVDDEAVYVVQGNTLERRSKHANAGITLASLNFGGLAGSLSTVPQSVSVDHRYVVVACNNVANEARRVYMLEKRTLSIVWYYDYVASGTYSVFYQAVTDGQSVFVAGGSAGAVPPGHTVWRLYRGNRPTMFRKVQSSDDYLMMRQNMIPLE